MKKEFHLVLGFDTLNDNLMKTYQEIVINQARLLYASALLAHGAQRDGSTAPDIHLYSDDFLAGKEDLDMPAVAPEQSPVALPAPTPERSEGESKKTPAVVAPDLTKSGAAGNPAVPAGRWGDEEEAP